MKSTITVVCLGALSLTIAAARAGSLNAETDIRSVQAAYSKLVFAARLGDLRERIVGSPANVAKEPLQVTLSNLKAGSISEIASTSLEELVSKPSGQVLNVGPGPWTIKTDTGEVLSAEVASVGWSAAGYLAEDWKVPFGALTAKGIIEAMYSRYVEASVNVKFEGQSRTYQALFLFGQDGSGKTAAFPLDNVIGQPALSAVIEANVVPQTLLFGVFRNRPEVSLYVNSLRAGSACVSDELTGMCCDSISGACGVPASQMQLRGFGFSALTSAVAPKPLCGPEPCSAFNTTGPQDPNSASNQNDHISGSHKGSVTFQSHCTYSGSPGSCQGLCTVSVNTPSATDSGSVKTACHKIATTQNNANGTNGKDCSAGWGMAVNPCLFCACNLSISVPAGGGNVTVNSGSAIWTYGPGETTGSGCRNIYY